LDLRPAESRTEEVAPESPVPHARIAELFAAIDKAVRSQRLYQPNNPVYRSFITAAQRAIANLWDDVGSFTVSVEESGFRWYGRLFAMGEGRETVPFLLYKDGIRFLTFLPGFEEEFERFLDVLNRGRALDQMSDDDMVTLLWQQEFTALQYSYVDALAEGLEIPGAVMPVLQGVQLTLVQQDAAAGPRRGPSAQLSAEGAAQDRPNGIIQPGDFEETLYFLDDNELATLRAELDLEFQRDLKADVLNALFDRLEDGIDEMRVEVVRALRQLLPVYLGSGDLRSASFILLELSSLDQRKAIEGQARVEVRALFDELSEPAVLTQFIRSLQDGSVAPEGDELAVFLRYLGPAAMPVLLEAVEHGEQGALQDRLRVAMEGLGRAHRDRLVALMKDSNTLVVRAAARLAGQLGITEAARPLAGLLERAELDLRRVAVEALVNIRTPGAMEALQKALIDDDRDVRISAARGFAALRYPPARERLQELLESRTVRDADITEKIAFFEACAAVGGQESVPLFDRILNGRRLLGKETPEMRACAAIALGRVGTPAAREALQRATAETQPIIRNAVLKALRQEAP
jgi:hypothetical protein